MTFTTATVSGQYLNGDASPATGSVRYTIPTTISNGGVTIAAGTSTTVTIDDNGLASAQLVSTTDPGTQPQGVLWRVDEVVGNATSTFFVAVPSGGASATIGALSPFRSGAPVAWA